MAAGAIIGGAISVIGGIFGSSRARREARRRENQARALESKLNELEANRQEIIDPYANITDLSSMLSNYNFFIVATGLGKRRFHFGKYIYKELDVTLASDCEYILHNYRPDIIVNAAALTNVDKCENDK